jgi:hypothetical protein
LVFNQDLIGSKICDDKYINSDLEPIVVVPNPSSNNISIQNTGFGGFKYNIFSMDGRLVLNGNNRTQIDISDFATGTYIIKLFYATTNKSQVAKFVVIR